MKNFLRIALGGLVLGGSAMVATQDQAVGYTTIGGTLGMTQRDFRLFNNFNGSSANNNTTINANWPQYDGAELAMWKGGAEWGSRAHGDGSGDSTQGAVGSGEANFSYFWNGEASGVGGTNDNIISSLGGSSGGVLAYAETPINNGWRIRFYGDAWSWQDGPGSVGSGIDIQGVNCHEMGHTLGLGHTTVSGSTMTAFISGTGTGQRSIQSDDINGVKFLYEARDDNKMPWIDSISGSLVPGGSVTINGGNFSPSNNTVWLQSDVVTSGNTGGDAEKVTGISSGSGTSMTFTLPNSGWTGGALHVQMDDTGKKSFSESHPFDGNGGGGTIGNDTIVLTASNFNPPAGSLVTFSWSGAPASSPYTFVWDFTNNAPFFATYRGLVGTGTTNVIGTGSINRIVPNGGSGRTVYMEIQVDDGGVIHDSNTLTISVP